MPTAPGFLGIVFRLLRVFGVPLQPDRPQAPPSVGRQPSGVGRAQVPNGAGGRPLR
jgi:hypothetical protein